jgi:hypothetical protein
MPSKKKKRKKNMHKTIHAPQAPDAGEEPTQSCLQKML